MPKATGASNYKNVEILLMLDIVRDVLPLGKEDWERVAIRYNAAKSDDWAARDYESLRRKFKQLYNIKKPTGDPTIPPHVLAAKELKITIDNKAGVVDILDAADCDDDDVGSSFPLAQRDENDEDETLVRVATLESFDSESNRLLDVTDGLRPVIGNDSPSTASTTLTHHGIDRYTFVDAMLAADDASTAGRSVNGLSGPAAAGKANDLSGHRATRFSAASVQRQIDDDESARFPTLRRSSNRLGGVDLGATPEPGRGKRSLDSTLSEASFVKQKKVRAEGVISKMKKKMEEHDGHLARGANDMFQLMMYMREDGERRAAARQEENEARRRLDQQERELAAREEREQREEIRRQEKLEADERRREDREDARQRSQELFLLVSALLKK